MARPRSADYDGKRLAILDRSAAVFAKHGYDRASMAQVAKACKVTKATLYHYFKSKETILKEILACRSEEINTLAAQTNPAASLEETFYQIAKAHLEHIKKPENLELMKILLSETMKNNEMRKYYMAFVHENISKGAQQVLGRYLRGKKNEKEMRLIFFQFMASLLHYDWNTRMVGDLTDFMGSDEAYIRQLAKTYALAVQGS